MLRIGVLHVQLAADARQIRRVYCKERLGWRMCRVPVFATSATGRWHHPAA